MSCKLCITLNEVIYIYERNSLYVQWVKFYWFSTINSELAFKMMRSIYLRIDNITVEYGKIIYSNIDEPHLTVCFELLISVIIRLLFCRRIMCYNRLVVVTGNCYIKMLYEYDVAIRLREWNILGAVTLLQDCLPDD